MNRAFLACLVVALTGCSAVVADLGSFGNAADACDPRGTAHVGDNLTIHFRNTTAHVNQDMRFAIEVGDHNVEALAVVSAFIDPDETIVLPEIMTNEPSTLAFWADTNANGVFDQLNPPDASMPILDAAADAGPIGSVAPDHQWFRPICPNGDMTFTHTTPFQDISHATSTGAVFRFLIPPTFLPTATDPNHHLFENFAMAAWVVQVDMQRQARVYYLWHPYVALGGVTPTQRTGPTNNYFQVGGNVLSEPRGAIDQGSTYEVHFVIDVDGDGRMDGHDTDDYNCVWMDQAVMPRGADPWEFDPTNVTRGAGLSHCDTNGFDPTMH